MTLTTERHCTEGRPNTFSHCHSRCNAVSHETDRHCLHRRVDTASARAPQHDDTHTTTLTNRMTHPENRKHVGENCQLPTTVLKLVNNVIVIQYIELLKFNV